MRRMSVIVPLALASLAALADGGREAVLENRREQLRQKWEQQFRAADANQDRSLTQEEVRAAGLPATLSERFAEIDRDHSGALTPEELMAVYEQRLAAQRASQNPKH